MANGDCAVGARNAQAIEELRHNVDRLETAVSKVAECTQRLETDNTLRKAGLDTGAKVLIALLGILGPLLAIVVAHYMQ
jgi:hypothetical protein